MATGVTASHDGRQPGAPSHGPVPGSPTLTNPDMILPDYEMPDSPQGRSQSPSMAWRDPNLDQMDFQLPPSNTYRSMPPTTPIIYGNGTMLSDIGEVTEAESTIGPSSRRASSRYSGYTENETFGPSSAALNKVYQRRSKMGRDRAASMESTSTITTQDQRATFGDFDDSVSVDDSNFQGDDEESMASGYFEGTIPKAARIRTVKAEEGNDQYSTAYISNQAEQILANAKRRLTAMEGNLFRARSSLGYSDGSTPSPQNGQPGSAHRDGATGIAPSHSRIKSDDIREVKQPAQFLQRSASAMGAAGGYRQPSSRSRRNEPELPTTDRPTYGISQHPLDTTLEVLSEDEDQESLYDDSIRDSAQLSSFLSPTFGVYSERGLTRSHSVAQMRDIQDQMQGLRGKISSLKQQARVDSMKRRSLQSLRTPSPFTHAQWGLGLMEPRQIRDVNSGDATPTPGSADGEDEQGKTSHNGVVESDGDAPIYDERKSSGSEPQHSDSSSKKQENGVASNRGYISDVDVQSSVNDDIDDDMRTENGDAVEDYSDGVYRDAHDNASEYESESGESTYHDSYQDQTSHEDREDAFDYEHFFLHSAMGSISRQSRRDDTGSDYSDDSVETTRGPMSSLSRKRRSVETNASDDTFATATEGRASRSSAFKSEYGTATDGGYDELPPLEEVRSHEDEGERDGQYDTSQRHNSVLYRPTSAAQADRLHRPSVSSFESTGTNRSFPLVNKAKLNGGVLTPGDSPDPILRSMSETLMGETTSAAANRNGQPGPTAAPIQGLHKDDQAAVERLVANLGKCVLGLGEASRAGSEGRDFRRRIDAARRILEGSEEI